MTREGQVDGIGEEPGPYGGLTLSGDGARLAFDRAEDVWIRDLGRGTTTRMTFEDGYDTFLGAWTADGDQLAVSGSRSGNWELYLTTADGTGSLENLLEKDFAQHVNSMSPDGVVLFHENNPATGIDLWTLPPDMGPTPLANSPFNEQQGRFSPDGRFIAYVSDESGRNEVYVRPYPGPGERVTISDAGGIDPLWSPAGDELFYRQADDLIAVTVLRSPTITFGDRRRLMDVGAFHVSGDVSPMLAISPDSERFLMVRKAAGARRQINVVLNWHQELLERVPVD